MIVSHNTFSYLHPINWWGWLLYPFAKCQKNDVFHQKFEAADIRVRFDFGRKKWFICHGPLKYCSLTLGLELLRTHGIHDIRILIENQPKATTSMYMWLENHLKEDYSEFKFYTGRRRSDWTKVLNFPDLPDLTQYVGSMAGGIIGNICPWLWWYFKGRHHQDEYIRKTENTSLDFI